MRATLDQRGMALVVVLLVMALMVALVVEFAQRVQTGSDHLSNWMKLQQLSLAADSGVSLAARAARTIKDNKGDVKFFLPPYEITGEDIFVSIEVLDETARFHLTRLHNDDMERKQYQMFMRLVEAAGLEEKVAGYIADWVDQDKDERYPGSELDSPDLPLDSIDELLHIPGIDTHTYAKLKPYVTTYGSQMVNVNLAEMPVLLTLAPGITNTMAEQIIEGREDNRYDDETELSAAVPGLLAMEDRTAITFSGAVFSVVSTAMDTDGLKRVVDATVTDNNTVLYWKEH